MHILAKLRLQSTRWPLNVVDACMQTGPGMALSTLELMAAKRPPSSTLAELPPDMAVKIASLAPISKQPMHELRNLRAL